MEVSANRLKWALRLYPPLLFQRIWVKKIEKDFRAVHVKIFRSPFNLNYNRSIFGGTIVSAADPFYPVLLHQVLSDKGLKTKIWVKRSEAEFLKPAFEDLFLKISLEEAEIDALLMEAENTRGVVKTFSTEIVNAQGELCCLVRSDIYIRFVKEG